MSVNWNAIERRTTCIPHSVQPSQRHNTQSSSSAPAAQRRPRSSSDRPQLQTSTASGNTSVMATRLTASRFVGRIGELAELEHALRDASDGRPAVVLLGGESGIGKTRLVSEFAGRITADEPDSALVLRGEGVEQREGELPYAPLLSALRPLARSNHPVL